MLLTRGKKFSLNCKMSESCSIYDTDDSDEFADHRGDKIITFFFWRGAQNIVCIVLWIRNLGITRLKKNNN